MRHVHSHSWIGLTPLWLWMLAVLGCSSPAATTVDSGPISDADDRGSPIDANDAAPPSDAGDATPPIDADDAGICPDSGDCKVTPPDFEPPDLAEMCGETPTTMEDWERCFAIRTCIWEVNCRPNSTYTDTQECFDLADAVSGGRLAAERRERQRAIDQGRAFLDEEAFARCLVERSDERCDSALHHPSCRTRFVGTVDDGDACYSHVECASPGATCERDCNDSCCEGTCRPAFKEGEICTHAASCEPGLQCHATCVAGEIGMPCRSSGSCEPAGWCDGDCGICTPNLPEGALCDSVLQCGGQTQCVGLAISEGEPGKCLRVTEPGDTCDTLCLGNLICGEPSDPSLPGACKHRPDVGQACGTTGCRGVRNECRDGQCVERKGEGESCAAASCLPGLFCTAELGEEDPICRSAQPDGETCTQRHQCASYSCSGDENAPGICLPWSETCPV